MNPYKSYPVLLFTVVRARVSVVVDGVLTCLNSPEDLTPFGILGSGPQCVASSVRFDISLAYEKNPENCSVPLRILFWEPLNCSGNTVCMANHSDGMSHTVSRLAQELPYTWINIRIHAGPSHPASFFDYYADGGRVVRSISSYVDEDGWIFFQEGPVQSFENKSYYHRRLKKDRLNRAIITEYMAKLGFNIQEDAFWKASGGQAFLLREERSKLRTGGH